MNCRHCHAAIRRVPDMDHHIAAWRKHWPEEEVDAVEAWGSHSNLIGGLKLMCQDEARWHVPEISEEEVIKGLQLIEMHLR